MLPEAEDNFDVTIPNGWLQVMSVDMFLFEVVHKDVGVRRCDSGAYSGTSHLKVIFTIKLEVVVCS